MYNPNLLTNVYFSRSSSVAMLWSADLTTLRLRSGQAKIHPASITLSGWSELPKPVLNRK